LISNISKVSDISSIDGETDEIVPLFNSPKHILNEHFTIENRYFIGLTLNAGATTILLQLNNPARVEKAFVKN
jgi:hypothetical protein